MFRVARKIRVGRETGNTHIFFFFASACVTSLLVYTCVVLNFMFVSKIALMANAQLL